MMNMILKHTTTHKLNFSNLRHVIRSSMLCNYECKEMSPDVLNFLTSFSEENHFQSLTNYNTQVDFYCQIQSEMQGDNCQSHVCSTHSSRLFLRSSCRNDHKPRQQSSNHPSKQVLWVSSHLRQLHLHVGKDVQEAHHCVPQSAVS